MEHGIWQGKPLLAMEIAEDYELEKEIRRASSRGELRCPDPDCGSPLLKYCHGEIRGAYFAHRTQEDCDYARFDQVNGGVMQNIRRCLYEVLRQQGLAVEVEAKVLPHRYVSLVITEKDGSRTVVELGTQQTTIRQLEKLQLACVQEDMRLRWLVADKTDTLVQENQTYFLKRYLLNEGADKTLLVVSWDGRRLTQYRRDEKRYVKNGVEWLPEGYAPTYMEGALITELVYENKELTIRGFNKRFLTWQEAKRTAFEMEIQRMEEEQDRIRKRQEWRRSVTQEQVGNRSRKSTEDVKVLLPEEKESAEQAERETICLQLEQQEIPARDAKGRRLVCCEYCGKIDTENQFYTYGGKNHINLGVCYECRESETEVPEDC